MVDSSQAWNHHAENDEIRKTPPRMDDLSYKALYPGMRVRNFRDIVGTIIEVRETSETGVEYTVLEFKADDVKT